MKTSLFVLCLILGYWVYQSSSSAHDQDLKPELKSLPNINKQIGLAKMAGQHNVATQVSIDRMPAAIANENSEHDPLVFDGVRYKSKADMLFNFPYSRRAKFPFFRKLYDDVGLTADEAYELTMIEARAVKEIYEIAVLSERPVKTRKESKALFRWYLQESRKVEERAREEKMKFLGGSRYEILEEGRERFAQEWEDLYGTRYSTEGW